MYSSNWICAIHVQNKLTTMIIYIFLDISSVYSLRCTNLLHSKTFLIVVIAITLINTMANTMVDDIPSHCY